jgi:23S rRNA pseudouridine1911/1915/1917 synthase
LTQPDRPWKTATRPSGVAEGAIVRVFRVPPELAGTRVDVFLTSQLRNTSRTRAKLIAEQSVYSLDGRKLRANDRVHAEDHLAVWRMPPDESDRPVDLPVLYEDEHLFVIDKPPMVAVHPTARHHSVTVIKLLQAKFPEQFFSLIHRIDRETSGVLMCGRSPAADRAFKRLIEDRSIAHARGGGPSASAPSIKKTYLAITWGIPSSGIIDLPLERDATNPLRVKMRVIDGGLESKTDVTVIATADAYALVRCELLTGRQHQIRVHLAGVGCPIVGDKLYGPDERILARAADGELTDEDHARLELPRHALHAHRYRLPHAVTGEPLDLESPLPPDLAAFWESRPRKAAEGAAPTL